MGFGAGFRSRIGNYTTNGAPAKLVGGIDGRLAAAGAALAEDGQGSDQAQGGKETERHRNADDIG